MTRFDLAIPFILKDKFKKLGAKWDMHNKLWYCEKDELPKELEDYVIERVELEYDKKDIMKSKITSLFFYKKIKSWCVAKKDLEDFDKYYAEII